PVSVLLPAPLPAVRLFRPRPARSTLFPYTTLFRSLLVHHRMHGLAGLLRGHWRLGHRHDLAIELHRRRHTSRDKKVGTALLDHQTQQLFKFHLSRPLLACATADSTAVYLLLEVFRRLGLLARGITTDKPLAQQVLQARIESLHAQRAAGLDGRIHLRHLVLANQ